MSLSSGPELIQTLCMLIVLSIIYEPAFNLSTTIPTKTCGCRNYPNEMKQDLQFQQKYKTPYRSTCNDNYYDPFHYYIYNTNAPNHLLETNFR